MFKNQVKRDLINSKPREINGILNGYENQKGNIIIRNVNQ